MKDRETTWPAKFIVGITGEAECLDLNRKLQHSAAGFSVQTQHFSIQIQMVHFTLEQEKIVIGSHQHQFIELAFPLRGMQYRIEPADKRDRSASYDSGLLLIPPKTRHDRIARKKSALCFSIVFDLQSENGSLLESFYQEVRRKRWKISMSGPMRQVLAEAAEGFSRDDEFSGYVCLLQFNRFLIELMRENFPGFFQKPASRNSAGRAETIRIFLENNLTSPRIMEDLSRTLYLSPRHLNRIFRNTYGLSVKQWLIRERIRLAAQKLLTSDEQVKAIADSCGFANMSYFTRQFRKLYQLLPSIYRKKG